MHPHRRCERGLTLLHLMIALGLVLLVVVVGGLATQDCTGGTGCASTVCSETAPCTVNGTVYTVGNVCAAGVEGSVCVDHTWPFSDCTCHTVVRPNGQGPAAVCAK